MGHRNAHWCYLGVLPLLLTFSIVCLFFLSRHSLNCVFQMAFISKIVQNSYPLNVELVGLYDYSVINAF